LLHNTRITWQPERYTEKEYQHSHKMLEMWSFATGT